MDSYHNKSFLINILKNCTAEVFRWSKSYCQVVLTFSYCLMYNALSGAKLTIMSECFWKPIFTLLSILARKEMCCVHWFYFKPLV